MGASPPRLPPTKTGFPGRRDGNVQPVGGQLLRCLAHVIGEALEGGRVHRRIRLVVRLDPEDPAQRGLGGGSVRLELHLRLKGEHVALDGPARIRGDEPDDVVQGAACRGHGDVRLLRVEVIAGRGEGGLQLGQRPLRQAAQRRGRLHFRLHRGPGFCVSAVRKLRAAMALPATLHCPTATTALCGAFCATTGRAASPSASAAQLQVQRPRIAHPPCRRPLHLPPPVASALVGDEVVLQLPRLPGFDGHRPALRLRLTSRTSCDPGDSEMRLLTPSMSPYDLPSMMSFPQGVASTVRKPGGPTGAGGERRSGDGEGRLGGGRQRRCRHRRRGRLGRAGLHGSRNGGRRHRRTCRGPTGRPRRGRRRGRRATRLGARKRRAPPRPAAAATPLVPAGERCVTTEGTRPPVGVPAGACFPLCRAVKA